MTNNTNETPVPEALIGIREVARRVGCSQRSIWRLVSTGSIPAPAKLGTGQMSRWRSSAVERWILDGCPAILSDGEPAPVEPRGRTVEPRGRTVEPPNPVEKTSPGSRPPKPGKRRRSPARRVDAPALLTFAQTAARLGITTNALGKRARVGTAPKPFARIGRNPLWLASDFPVA